MNIKSLHIYPIKSLGGISLSTTKVERRGFQYDRRWMLIDENSRFISQRENPKLALLQPEINGETMTIMDRSQQLDALTFSLAEPESHAIKVMVWDDECLAKPLNQSVNDWFSNFMRKPIQLVYMHEGSQRIADQRYAPKSDDLVSFADGYPILAISQKSVDLLSEKLGHEIASDRFRPNIVISGIEAHEEDTLAEIELGGLKLFGVKPCARCVMITINQQTAEQGKEPTKTLSNYRKVGHKILFGENFIPDAEGQLSVGDELKILRRKPTAFEL
ncbi:MAG TPA: MOSC N-terminal beta barrel domain-containing protein [Roseivirga sp.]